jgi:hypothetical protein
MTRQELIDDLKAKGLDDANTIAFAMNCYDAGWHEMLIQFNILQDAHQRLLGELKQLRKQK